jgi:hypothetical protein
MSTERRIDFRYAPASRWTSICRPDDPYKSLVREDGAMLYDYHSASFGAWYFGRVFEFGIQTHHLPDEVSQRTEDARTPVVITTIAYPHATLELRAFGHLHDGGRRTDVVLWTIRPNEGMPEFLTGLHIDAYESGRVFVGRSVLPARDVFAVPPEDVPSRAGEMVNPTRDTQDDLPAPGPLAMVSAPQRVQTTHATGYRPVTGLMTEPRILRPGEAMQGALFFPLNHEEGGGFDLDWARSALSSERAYWRGYDLQPLTMEIPDPDVMEMLESCARNIEQAREVKDGLAVFQVGPAVYRGLWIVDGHFLLEAAQYMGHREAAAQGIRVLLARAKESGAIEVMPFHSKETGIALATFVRQCELTGDMGTLERVWPTIRRGVEFIQGLRERSKERGPDAPEYGLMPPSFGDGGLAGMRPEYTTPLWTLAGLKSAAGAAARLGEEEDAERFGAAFEDLMRSFREHAERDMRSLPDGTPYLPMLMPGSGEHIMIPDYPGEPEPWWRANPGTATWALAHAIYPGEVFAPDDPLVRNFCHLLDLIDDEEGIPAATGWLPYEAVWNYAASFYAHVWLYAGRPDKAVDYLYAFANHAAPTRVWREEQSFVHSQHDQKVGDMPHNWASAEFIRLVRHLLVFERGDTLELLPGLPREWCMPGRPIRLEWTPTRFGPVSLTVEVGTDGRVSMDVAMDTGWSRRPECRVLHVPGFMATTAGKVLINGEEVAVAENGTVELPEAGNIRVGGLRLSES